MTLYEFESAVEEISLELPDELFDRLNGGVVVQPGEKLHKSSLPDAPLYIAGEYVRSQAMRTILIYYGSFMRLYRFETDEGIKRHIREVLQHELRHHWEGLSGERGLEIEDEEHISAYLDSHISRSEPEFVYGDMNFDGSVSSYGEDTK